VKVGIPEAKLAALDHYRDSPQFSPREVAALEYAEEIVRDDHTVSDACFDRLRAHFTEPETVELTFIVGFQSFASTFAKAFQIPVQGFAAT
jgi:alkylhydroperoxidase family enzyme